MPEAKVKKEIDVSFGIDNSVVTAIGRILINAENTDAVMSPDSDMYMLLEAYIQTRYAMAHLESQATTLMAYIEEKGGMGSVCDTYDSGMNGALSLRGGKSATNIKTHKLVAQLGVDRAMKCMVPQLEAIKKEVSKVEMAELTRAGVITKIAGTGTGFSVMYNKPTTGDNAESDLAKNARAALDAALL